MRQLHPPFMFGLAVASLTSVVGYRFYNQPQLSLGTRAPATVIAPQAGSFTDSKTTEERRKAIRSGMIPVLKRDRKLMTHIESDFGNSLQQIDHWRKHFQSLPYWAKTALDPDRQLLRMIPTAQWPVVLEAVLSPQPPSDSLNLLNPPQKKAIASLQRLKRNLAPAAFNSQLNQINLERQSYQQLLQQLKTESTLPLTLAQINQGLSLSNLDWQLTQATLKQAIHRMLSQGIPPGLPDFVLNEAIESQLTPNLPLSSQNFALQLLRDRLRPQPNLVIDQEETQRQAEAAAQAMEPIVVRVQKGETIVRRGEIITQADFVLLDGLKLSRRGTNWFDLLLTAVLISGGIVLLCWVSQFSHRPLRRRDHLLLCILSLSVPFMSLINPRYSTLPAVAILVGSYYGAPIAVTQVLMLGGISAFAVGSIAWEYVLGGIAGSLVAAFLAGKLRSRYELALLGGGVGLVQGTVYFVGHLILSTSATPIWYIVLPGAALYGLAGMVWSVIALGLSPYLEHFFDVVTPTRLVELSDPNSPLLKRLATETPGTFQHTLFVSCLAEAAARELRCNVELVRAGTLYHDIGKMHDPLGFIENQMGQPNKHDQINDPRKSVELIKKHVSEGLVMARKYHLPRVVKNFIPEHQGTLLIAYFYYQAQQQALAMGLDPNAVQESDFRYAGPIPQSRETAIVMLADGCEAALRSLKEATPESALTMVNKIFKARWREGQLSDSGLKYEELPLIAEIYVRVWQQFHHQRIVYPKGALEPQGVK
jgi:hypothetical protein